MFERKGFVDEAPVEELVADTPHVFLGDFMLAYFLFSIREVLRSQTKFLWYSSEESLTCLLFLLTRCFNSRDESNPDLMLLTPFNQANVLVISATLLYSNPPMFAHFVVFCFIILEDRCHLLSGQQDKGIEYKMQVCTSLFHMDFLKSLYEYVAL